MYTSTFSPRLIHRIELPNQFIMGQWFLFGLWIKSVGIIYKLESDCFGNLFLVCFSCVLMVINGVIPRIEQICTMVLSPLDVINIVKVIFHKYVFSTPPISTTIIICFVVFFPIKFFIFGPIQLGCACQNKNKSNRYASCKSRTLQGWRRRWHHRWWTKSRSYDEPKFRSSASFTASVLSSSSSSSSRNVECLWWNQRRNSWYDKTPFKHNTRLLLKRCLFRFATISNKYDYDWHHHPYHQLTTIISTCKYINWMQQKPKTHTLHTHTQTHYTRTCHTQHLHTNKGSKNQTSSDCGIPLPASKPKIWSLADTAACKTPPPIVQQHNAWMTNPYW